MNECYAVDPTAPRNARELKQLLNNFGLQTGRFVARYPLDWRNQLLDAALSWGDHQRITELLKEKRGALLAQPNYPYDQREVWAVNASLVAKKHKAFDEMIGTVGNNFGWPSIEEVLSFEVPLPEGRGAHVDMRVQSYRECVVPIFLASVEVFLVDPYFSLRTKRGDLCERRWPVLDMLLREAEKSRVCESLWLLLERRHIEGTEGSEHQLKIDFERVEKEAGCARVKLRYRLLESFEVGHGRYLFSKEGGLQFDQGFEVEARSRSTNHVHWLSKPELTPLLDRFLPSTRLAVR